MWQTPTNESLGLADGDVHVWRWSLAASAEEIAARKLVLSPDEVARAERFYFARHHDAFVAARAGLRRTLARYLATPAESIEFLYGHAGKPELSGRHAGDEPALNHYHSGDLALCAVARRGPLGIDVEMLRPMNDAAGLARRYFASAEVKVWQGLPADEQIPAFFRCWTRKEAYLKALGDGLRAPLDRFVVSLAPGEPPRLIQPSPHDTAAGWSIEDIDMGKVNVGEGEIGDGYVAALVVPAGFRAAQYLSGD
ncbi:MAG: 4'-phosphopantetheinyl transferase superfamily protein [Pirellulales bacterium]